METVELYLHPLDEVFDLIGLSGRMLKGGFVQPVQSNTTKLSYKDCIFVWPSLIQGALGHASRAVAQRFQSVLSTLFSRCFLAQSTSAFCLRAWSIRMKIDLEALTIFITWGWLIIMYYERGDVLVVSAFWRPILVSRSWTFLGTVAMWSFTLLSQMATLVGRRSTLVQSDYGSP